MMRPPIDQIRVLLSYDPQTGNLVWIKKPSDKIMIGRLAGYVSQHGYIVIRVCGCHLYGHHIAWALMTGEWPKQIDHRDGNRSNNRWGNLRTATNQQNAANKKRLGELPKGVRKNRKVYCAQITVDGKNIYLGTYQTPEIAHSAYIEAANRYFGEFARAA